MLLPDVPVMNSNLNTEDREELLQQMKAVAVSRVWIALDRKTLFEDRTQDLQMLADNLRFFEQNGLEAGVWIQAFGFGDPLPYRRRWSRIRSLAGVERNESDCFCPEDPGFIKAYLAWVEDIARLHPKLIMLDDDLCLSVRPGIGCFCERHQKLLGIKEPQNIFVGGRNPDRDTYLQVMGDTLRRFCKKVRTAVDRIDPNIRVGHCAGYTSWDLEGADPIELSRILAGQTKPFFRLTAAPYWAAPKKMRFPGQRLSAIIENARCQAVWSKNQGIEFFAEADSYPRPCYNTPAMLVENFDIAMHASGIRSLKYLFDYHSTPHYEKQYWKIHRRDLPLYEKIEEAFSGARPCGIRVYHPAHRIAEDVFPAEFAGEKAIMRSYFSGAAAMLACHAIPVCYEGENPYAVAFGNDARFLTDPHQKVVLDLPAALLLQEKGVDVGIASVGEPFSPAFEVFEKERVPLIGGAASRNLMLKEGALVQSRFDNGMVASYGYQNYLVLNFNGADEASVSVCSYKRGEQLLAFFGNPYPSISGYSELYSICAEREGMHIVLFQNLSIDPIFDFEIQLPSVCKAFSLYNGEGIAKGDKIFVGTELPPQGCLLLEVEYDNG